MLQRTALRALRLMRRISFKNPEISSRARELRGLVGSNGVAIIRRALRAEARNLFWNDCDSNGLGSTTAGPQIKIRRDVVPQLVPMVSLPKSYHVLRAWSPEEISENDFTSSSLANPLISLGFGALAALLTVVFDRFAKGVSFSFAVPIITGLVASGLSVLSLDSIACSIRQSRIDRAELLVEDISRLFLHRAKG